MFCHILVCCALCCVDLFSAAKRNKSLKNACNVLYCLVLFCSVVFCTLMCYLPIGTKKSLKCFVLSCHALFCPVLCCFVLFYKGLSSKPSSVPTGLFIYGIKSKIAFNSFSILNLFLKARNSEYAQSRSALYSSGFCIIRLIDL